MFTLYRIASATQKGLCLSRAPLRRSARPSGACCAGCCNAVMVIRDSRWRRANKNLLFLPYILFQMTSATFLVLVNTNTRKDEGIEGRVRFLD